MRDKTSEPDIIEWLEGEARKLRNIAGSDPYDLHGDAREAAEKIREVIAELRQLRTALAECEQALTNNVWGKSRWPIVYRAREALGGR